MFKWMGCEVGFLLSYQLLLTVVMCKDVPSVGYRKLENWYIKRIELQSMFPKI